MHTRERQHDDRQHPQSDGALAGSGLDALTANAERMLAAGDDAIDRALSGNSDAFLRANRQHGGE
jgi:hypothetical protein